VPRPPSAASGAAVAGPRRSRKAAWPHCATDDRTPGFFCSTSTLPWEPTGDCYQEPPVCSARSGAAGHVTVTIARCACGGPGRAVTGRDVLRLHGEFAPCVAVDVDLRILRPHTPRRQPLLQRLLSNAAPPASATFVAAKPTASWRARQLP
jgi:hypothetical protein